MEWQLQVARRRKTNRVSGGIGLIQFFRAEQDCLPARNNFQKSDVNGFMALTCATVRFPQSS
jgi:hypothetical protein